MFAKTKASKLAQRSFGALRLTCSFLLLEDDYDVDWEVDRDERLTQQHPHRVPLRGPGRRSRRATARRAGQVVPARHICLAFANTTPDLAHTSHERPPCTRPHAQRSRH